MKIGKNHIQLNSVLPDTFVSFRKFIWNISPDVSWSQNNIHTCHYNIPKIYFITHVFPGIFGCFMAAPNELLRNVFIDDTWYLMFEETI